MQKTLIAFILTLISGNIYADVLNDSDVPTLREALKKNYTFEQCQTDMPNASKETCACLGDAMAQNLDAEKLKLCKPEGYDQCVAAEFAAAKSNLTEKQISDCKAVSSSDDEAVEE